MTPLQRKRLSIALKKGYFEYPKKLVHTIDIAKIEGVTVGAMSQCLRRGLSNLIQMVIDFEDKVVVALDEDEAILLINILRNVDPLILSETADGERCVSILRELGESIQNKREFDVERRIVEEINQMKI